MSRNTRASGGVSFEAESTIGDIWQLTEMQGQSDNFDPQNINAALAMKRQIQKDARPSDRFSISQYLSDGSPTARDSASSRPRRSTNVNLQRSLQVLDEAVGTQGAGLNSTRNSAYTTQGRLLRDTSMDTSVFGRRAVEHARTNDPPMDPDDVTSTNVALLLEEDPGIAACTGLFGDFSRALTGHASLHQVFQLVLDYQTLCRENTEQLNKLIKRSVPGQSKFTKTVDVLMQLTQESCTWSLIASLYKDRLEHEVTSDGEEPMMIDSLGKYQSEKDIIANLYEKDRTVRQAQMVVDWLERNSREQQEVYHRVEFFTDDMGAWENTHYALKQKQSGQPTGTERPIVTSLDPDAPIREGRPLADLDLEDESRLLQHVFVLIRGGQLEEAQKLCMRVGQAWRAATLEGWRLYHDPNYESLQPDGRPHRVEGNPNRDLWKNVCWKMSEQERLDVYERAMYAAFSGNLRQLLAVCTTWEDYLWAYLRVFVDQQVEQEIRVATTHKRPLVQLPNQYWEKMLTTEKVFNDIQASTNKDIQLQSKAHYNVIQKYIILGDTDRLIEEMYEWCKDDMKLPSPHLLRFMAHLVLFLQAIGVSTKEELCISILEAYVRYLIEEKQSHLVATYVATLPKSMQVEWYARFLEGVEDTDDRKECLRLAEQAGLDIPSATKLVVENIRKRDSEEGFDSEMTSETTTSKEDRQKIEAIDWLVFDPSQRAEALRQANAVMISFLAVRKLAAAREVFNKIPAGSIDVIIKTWASQTGSTTLRPEDDNAIREYLCHQAYLDAHDSFNDWFEHYHNAKPSKPHIPQGANFTERVAFEHKERQYEMDLGRWKHNLLMQTKMTKEKIYNVLLFVDGGWMIDQRQDGERDPSRTHQMRLIRQLCLPPLCFLLHTVLHSTEQYQESIRLADLIVSEQHQLYKTFRRDELKQLLRKIRESSLCLLNSNLDPLGYSLTDLPPGSTS